MSGSIFLPIESRKSCSVLLVPSLDVDQPVEAVSAELKTITSPVSKNESKEAEIDNRINRASFNAEYNRRMSSDKIQREETTPSPPGRGFDRDRAIVQFGNESDLEYDADGSPNGEFKRTVRISKEFDGNRSGRKSLKQ